MPDNHRHHPDHLDNSDHLDALLDQALAQYVDAEPDPSLRARVHARIAETTRRPRRAWLLAPLAACAAAVVTVATLVHTAPQRVPHSDEARVEALSTTHRVSDPGAARVGVLPQPDPERMMTGVVHRHGAGTTYIRSLPAPPALTPEEIILLRFATEHPQQARAVLASGAGDNAPLDTPAISIAPIHIAALSEAQTAKSLD